MSWLEIIAVAVMILGVGAAAFLVAQRPTFWVGLAIAAWSRAWPLIWMYVSKRNSPEIEAKMQECIRRGGEWDNFKKKCREKR